MRQRPEQRQHGGAQQRSGCRASRPAGLAPRLHGWTQPLRSQSVAGLPVRHGRGCDVGRGAAAKRKVEEGVRLESKGGCGRGRWQPIGLVWKGCRRQPTDPQAAAGSTCSTAAGAALQRTRRVGWVRRQYDRERGQAPEQTSVPDRPQRRRNIQHAARTRDGRQGRTLGDGPKDGASAGGDSRAGGFAVALQAVRQQAGAFLQPAWPRCTAKHLGFIRNEGGRTPEAHLTSR